MSIETELDDILRIDFRDLIGKELLYKYKYGLNPRPVMWVRILELSPNRKFAKLVSLEIGINADPEWIEIENMEVVDILEDKSSIV